MVAEHHPGLEDVIVGELLNLEVSDIVALLRAPEQFALWVRTLFNLLHNI